jgi:methionyl-tRNA synthetase
MSAGIELPRRVYAHGFLLNKGEKMSKSVGNVVDPFDLVSHFGVDQVRNFFLREVSFGQDGSYSREAIGFRINADLANNVGNLAQRTLKMIAANFAGKVPNPSAFMAVDEALLTLADKTIEACRQEMAALQIHKSTAAVFALASEANGYFAEQAPWTLVKDDEKRDMERAAAILYVSAEVVRQIGILLLPYMPASADKLLDQLAIPATERKFSHLGEVGRLKSGIQLEKPPEQGVFPRYVAPKE